MRDQTDALLTATFQDVPVPDGLAERLLDRLAADLAEGSAHRLHLDIAGGGINVPISPNRQVASYKRRWLLVGGGVLAVAAGLVVAVYLGAPGKLAFPSRSFSTRRLNRSTWGSRALGDCCRKRQPRRSIR